MSSIFSCPPLTLTPCFYVRLCVWVCFVHFATFRAAVASVIYPISGIYAHVQCAAAAVLCSSHTHLILDLFHHRQFCVCQLKNTLSRKSICTLHTATPKRHFHCVSYAATRCEFPHFAFFTVFFTSSRSPVAVAAQRASTAQRNMAKHERMTTRRQYAIEIWYMAVLLLLAFSLKAYDDGCCCCW